MAKQLTNPAQGQKIDLVITTPRGIKFEEKADMVIMRCIDGDLGCFPVTSRYRLYWVTAFSGLSMTVWRRNWLSLGE